MKIKGIELNLGYDEVEQLSVFDGDSSRIARAVNYAVGGLLCPDKQRALERVLESLGIDLDELRAVLAEKGYGWESTGSTTRR